MTQNRLKSIKTWADETLKVDSATNTQVLLGMAVAHINELLEGIESIKAEQKQKDVAAESSKVIKDILDMAKDNMQVPNPLTQPLPFKPYNPIMYGADFKTVSKVDSPVVTVNGTEPLLFTYTNTVNIPAEAISDELVESVSNDTKAVDAVLDRLNDMVGLSDAELEKVEKVDASEFSKPTKLETLLAEHFEVEKKYAETYIDKMNAAGSKNLVFDNLTPEQRLGLKPFEGTMNDIQVGVPYSQIEKQIKSEQERNILQHQEKQKALEEEKRVSAEEFLKTNVVEDAFTNKYGGTVATIEQPYDGYAALAPGMSENGFIEDNVAVYPERFEKMVNESHKEETK